MKRLVLRISAGFILAMMLSFASPASVGAQNSSSGDNLSPKTQQYIDNLNEVQQVQNDGKPVDTSSKNSASGGLPGFWTIVFYGFLSGVTYAFWRWLKRLKNGN